MPTGIILSSASAGATKEAVEKVLADHGYEVEKPEPAAGAAAEEPKRETFESEEEFEAAQTAWQEAREAVVAAEEEPKREVFASDEEFEEAQEAWQEAHPPVAPPAAKKSRMQRKVERATGELRRELDDAKKRLAELEGGGAVRPAAKEKNPRPKREGFASNEEYEDALLAWGTEKALSEKAMKEAQQNEQTRLQENYDGYRAQVEEFKDEHDDWDEVVNQDIPMHTGVQLAVMEQENGAEVIYYLGKHPDYTRKLAQMSPLSAVMEVGRLSARLQTGAPGTGEANGGKTQKPKPKLPAPVRPVSTAATASTLTSRDAAEARNLRAFKAARRSGR